MNAKATKEQTAAILLLFILILCLLGFFFAPKTDACVGVTEFVKNWGGNWADSVRAITVTLSNGTVVYTGNDASQIDIKGIWQGQSITIAWIDGAGRHTETFGPLYPTGGVSPTSFEDGVETFCHGTGPVVKTNIVNHPTVPTQLR